MNHPTLASILAGAALLSVPAEASAQVGSPTPSLTSPLAACYSPTFADFKGENVGDPQANFDLGTLDVTGPPNSQWDFMFESKSPRVVGGANTFQFGADGRASVLGASITPGNIGPGTVVNATTRQSGSDPDVPATVVGTTKVTMLGVELPLPGGRPRSRPASSSSRPQKVVVSGTAFANKPLYGYVGYLRGSLEGRPKVLRRVKLGIGDACGYLTTKADVHAKPRSGFLTVLYVNAGPKFTKARAVRTTL